MPLNSRVAVIHGGGGAVGGAIARAFARAGACIYLTGRTTAKLVAVARDIADDGGFASAAQVDALDAQAVDRHADAVAREAGHIDIAVNAVGIPHVQGKPLAELSLQEFEQPIAAYMRTNFLTARAAARHMVRQRAGAIMTLSTPGSKLAGSGFLGYGVTCAAVEALSRLLAAELGASGVRVICLRPDAIPAALAAGSHTRAVFRGPAEREGVSIEELLAARARAATLLGRLPTLDEVADAAVFFASDRASAITGAVANLTCGSLVD